MARPAAMLRAPEVVDEAASWARLADLDRQIAELRAELGAIEAELGTLAGAAEDGPDRLEFEPAALGSLGAVESFVADLVASAESELAADRAWAERAAAERIAHAAQTANDYLAVARARVGATLIELSQAPDPELVARAQSAADHLADAVGSAAAEPVSTSRGPETEAPTSMVRGAPLTDGLGMLDADEEAAFDAFVRRSEEAKAMARAKAPLAPRAPIWMRRYVTELVSSVAGLVVAIALTLMVVG